MVQRTIPTTIRQHPHNVDDGRRIDDELDRLIARHSSPDFRSPSGSKTSDVPEWADSPVFDRVPSADSSSHSADRISSVSTSDSKTQRHRHPRILRRTVKGKKGRKTRKYRGRHRRK